MKFLCKPEYEAPIKQSKLVDYLVVEKKGSLSQNYIVDFMNRFATEEQKVELRKVISDNRKGEKVDMPKVRAAFLDMFYDEQKKDKEKKGRMLFENRF